MTLDLVVPVANEGRRADDQRWKREGIWGLGGPVLLRALMLLACKDADQLEGFTETHVYKEKESVT